MLFAGIWKWRKGRDIIGHAHRLSGDSVRKIFTCRSASEGIHTIRDLRIALTSVIIST